VARAARRARFGGECEHREYRAHVPPWESGTKSGFPSVISTLAGAVVSRRAGTRGPPGHAGVDRAGGRL